jgi:glycerol-3-phosphate O-acyltransferase/dihydroxyacetone phosphate acyltransferase
MVGTMSVEWWYWCRISPRAWAHNGPPGSRREEYGVANPVRAVVGTLVVGGLRVYFRRIERFHAERAPAVGPTLFVSNHPGSLTDAFIIGSSVPRVVHFVATVRLFKSKPVAALLVRCGVIPINRRQDDPAAMRTVAGTFEHCFRVLEQGGAIGIFPEGVSYNDEQMRPIKTGAARMALEIEDRHDGALGLRIAPVGLTYEAKGRYRSDVLAHFGETFRAADWLPAYRADRHAGVRALSSAINQRIRALILDLPSLDEQRIVSSVKRLYLRRLRAGNLLIHEPMPAHAEELVLTQAIGQALKYFEGHDPDRLRVFVDDLMRYERRLDAVGLGDPALESVDDVAGRSGWPVWRAAALAMSAPLALYGWVHRLAPAHFIEWAVEKFSPRENVRAQIAHVSMIAGLIGFGALYAAAAAVMWHYAGPGWAAAYVLSLPLSGLFAHAWMRGLARVSGEMRAGWLLARMPFTRRYLVRMRARLIAEIEAFRAEYRREVLKVETAGPPRHAQ